MRIILGFYFCQHTHLLCVLMYFFFQIINFLITSINNSIVFSSDKINLSLLCNLLIYEKIKRSIIFI